MAHIENAPSPKAESVTCYLGGSSDVPSIGEQHTQHVAPGSILARHWFRPADLAAMVIGGVA